MTPTLFLALTASWCAPCQQLHRDYAADKRIEWIDIEQQPGVAVRHGVRTLPTVLAMRDGREVGRHVGYRGQREMNRWMESVEAEQRPGAR